MTGKEFLNEYGIWSFLNIIVADEMDAVDAWHDAVCTNVQELGPATSGWYACNSGPEEHHADTCPVEIAHKAMIMASCKRRDA